MVWGRLLDRHDNLRLLAAIAKANQVRIDDYEVPSVSLAERLRETSEQTEPNDRRTEVEQFIALTREV